MPKFFYLKMTFPKKIFLTEPNNEKSGYFFRHHFFV